MTPLSPDLIEQMSTTPLPPHAVRYAAQLYAALVTMGDAHARKANVLMKPLGTTPAHATSYSAADAIHGWSDRYAAAGVVAAWHPLWAAGEVDSTLPLPPPNYRVEQGAASAVLRDHLMGENLPAENHTPMVATAWLTHEYTDTVDGAAVEMQRQYRIMVFDTPDRPAQLGVPAERVTNLGALTITTDMPDNLLAALSEVLVTGRIAPPARPRKDPNAPKRKRRTKVQMAVDAARAGAGTYHDATQDLLVGWLLRALTGAPLAALAEDIRAVAPKAFAALVAMAQPEQPHQPKDTQ
jgi:hypothetical protein